MPKKSSDNLHLLIKSLNRNEKRYFKIFMQNNIRHENKVFDVLFDAIDKQEEYDEKELLKKFKDKAFAKQFALTKTRLYEQILRSLDALYADSSIDAELKQHLHFVEILFRKTLYRQAEKLLYHTRKKALRHEKISSLIEISMWQKRLLEKTGYAGHAEEEIQNIQKNDAWLLAQLNTNNDFWVLKSNLFSSLNKTGQTENLKEFAELLRKRTESLNYAELTTENKYIFHHTHSAYYFGINDYTNCYDHLVQNARLIEENSFLFKDEPNIYFSVLSNLIFICNRLDKNQEALDALRRLKNVQALFDISNNVDLELKHFNMLSSSEITLYKLTGNYEEALRSLAGIEISLERFLDKLNPTRKAFYFFNLSAVYLANSKLQHSLKWCNALLNDKDIDENENIRSFTLALSLLIHYDLGHHDYFNVIGKQLARQFAGKEKIPVFFSIIIKFAMQDGNKQSLQLLLSELKALEQTGDEKHAFEHFDFCRWAGSRLSGLPFSIQESGSA
jgi:hypothetical protein